MRTFICFCIFVCINILLMSTLTAQPVYGIAESAVPYDPNNPTGGPKSCYNPSTGDPCRTIFWVHGLGGDALKAWQKVGPDIETKYWVDSEFPEYPQISLKSAGQGLLDAIKNSEGVNRPLEDHLKPFVIAHSQGGLAVRAADLERTNTQKGDPYFGGIVTYGTPHGGAPILQHVDDMVDLMEEGCVHIANSKLTEFVESNFLLDLLINPEKIKEKIIKPACEFVSGVAPTFAADFLSPITDEYKQKPVFFNEFNSKIKNNVAFYGVEEDPVFFRLLKWLKTSAETVPVYTANEDQDMVDKVNQISDEYYIKYVNQTKWVEFLDGVWWHPGGWFGAWGVKNDYQKKADANRAVFDWFKTVDNKWKIIIGSGINYKVVTESYCMCVEYDANGSERRKDMYYGIDFEECDKKNNSWDYFCSHQEIYHYEFEEIEESDGVVPVSSAIDFPNSFKGELKYSNHQQMRNDGNTKKEMAKLLETNTYGTFFITQKH
ncbi:MAG: hypothetical protein IT264_15965 [Saprospiraceae bacterium]|nr:hypothetical protein [Saprospiraceae bacterium]